MLSWVDMYADYLAAFINPEGFKKLMDTQTVMAGASMDFTYVNPDASAKMKDAESGKKFEPSHDDDIAAKVRAVRERLGRKVAERQEEFDMKDKPHG